MDCRVIRELWEAKWGDSPPQKKYTRIMFIVWALGVGGMACIAASDGDLQVLCLGGFLLLGAFAVAQTKNK